MHLHLLVLQSIYRVIKDLVSEFKEKGIDTIACTSVNDVFVMDAWGKDQGLKGEIILLADGNGSFAKAVGLELDGSGFGMGSRSQRYAMVINDLVVENVFVEKGGEFKVSAADYLLEKIFSIRAILIKSVAYLQDLISSSPWRANSSARSFPATPACPLTQFH